MAYDPRELHARHHAENLVASNNDWKGVSRSDREAVVDTLVEDWKALLQRTASADERLAETQARLLSQGIVAMTDAAPAVTPAGKAVKGEL